MTIANTLPGNIRWTATAQTATLTRVMTSGSFSPMWSQELSNKSPLDVSIRTRAITSGSFSPIWSQEPTNKSQITSYYSVLVFYQKYVTPIGINLMPILRPELRLFVSQ